MRAGLSAKEAADRLLSSPTKISRLENAQRNATLRDVRDLCEIYGITEPAVRDELMDLARGSRERGWWQNMGLDPALEALIGMEGAARSIREFEPLALPGLLQTRSYARAMLEKWRADDPAGQDLAVEVRMRRQQIFEAASPPTIRVIVDEAALRRVVGGKTVMREQLEHLADLAETDVEVQVIRFSAGAHLGMSSGFTILEFAQPTTLNPEATIPAVVYAETLGGATYLDGPKDVRAYVEAFAGLSAQALSRADSLNLLRLVTQEL